MKYEIFNLVQERIKRLDLLEISEEIQDMFFEWSDENDIELLVFLGYVNDVDWIVPIWNILENNEIGRGLSEIHLDNTSILNCHLTIQFGLERWVMENRGSPSSQSYKDFENKSYQLQEIRENFISRLSNAFEFKIASDLYEYISYGSKTMWARKIYSRVPIGFRISIKDPKFK